MIASGYIHLRISTQFWLLTVYAVISISYAYVMPFKGSSSLISRYSGKLLEDRFNKLERTLKIEYCPPSGFSDADVVVTPILSEEQKLKLGVSIASMGFLKNIEEYGTARMARRAVGILSKMPAYREIPKQEHYTAAIWACENSDQFKLAMSVFAEMKDAGIARVTRTYEGLISVAEKTKNWKAAIDLFDEMMREGITGSTEACNSCIWAAEQGGRYDLSLKMLATMEQKGIPRNIATYAACAYSCEKAGEGNTALHVMELMRAEGYEIHTPVYKAAIWACVKAGMWEKSLSLFKEMEEFGILQDEDCYSGAIWACVGGVKWQKAVELLKLMKFEGLPRRTVSYDGALTALQLGGQWESCLDMLTWMDREIPVTQKSLVTYQTVLQALDDAGKEDEMKFIYQQASREGYFIPWVKGSRLADFRGYTLPIAKASIRNILSAMKDGKLAVFNLHIAICDAPQADVWLSHDVVHEENEILNEEPSFDVKKFEEYLHLLHPQGLLKFSRIKLDGLERLVLTRDSLAAWTTSSPFYGYEDSRNVWVERQIKNDEDEKNKNI